MPVAPSGTPGHELAIAADGFGVAIGGGSAPATRSAGPLRAVQAYADRMHATIGDQHHVASPLGAWLVLALAAGAARGETRARIEDVLGCPTDEARIGALILLNTPQTRCSCSPARSPPPSVGLLRSGRPGRTRRG